MSNARIPAPFETKQIRSAAPAVDWEAWAPPTPQEWRRAFLVIAKQVFAHVTGYSNSRERASLERRFARRREAKMTSAICSRFAPPAGWGVSRQTHPAIVQAIFALSTGDRDSETIWQSPTPDEWNEVAGLVAEYIKDGDFALDRGWFAWGPFETIRLWPARPASHERKETPEWAPFHAGSMLTA